MIEAEGVRFVLTASSGRKLKRAGVNLLAGRAWQSNLFPLCSQEIGDLDLDRYLLYGGMPNAYSSSYPEEELDAYINTYLKEEIREEAFVQNITHFSRFLRVAASCSSLQVNFANVARDTEIPASTIRSYFSILQDTYLGYLLEPWRESRKRKSVATAKFFLFDIGVANFLRGIDSLSRGSADWGVAFEHFIAMELRSYLSYRRIKKPLTYWRTHTGVEVDFLIGTALVVEVERTRKVTDKHLRGLRALREDLPEVGAIVVSIDETNRETEDAIRILHWRRFLEELWGDQLIPSGGAPAPA